MLSLVCAIFSCNYRYSVYASTCQQRVGERELDRFAVYVTLRLRETRREIRLADNPQLVSRCPPVLDCLILTLYAARNACCDMNVNFASEPERRRAMMPRQMQRLPPSTQSKIRSTQILTSLPQIISELVQNALDAGASHIDVGVDCEDWACWVRDDGCGIARDDFDALASGGQAARYSESPPQCLAYGMLTDCRHVQGLFACISGRGFDIRL